MSGIPRSDLTGLLLKWSDGDREALDQLMPLVYDELHRLARHHSSSGGVRKTPSRFRADRIATTRSRYPVGPELVTNCSSRQNTTKGPSNRYPDAMKSSAVPSTCSPTYRTSGW